MRFIPQLDAMTPYEPGQPLELVMRRFGLSEVVKLASNEFPLPPVRGGQAGRLAALDDLNRYPDGHCTDLRAALAAHYGRRDDEIAVGNGSCELLMLLGDVAARARRRGRLRRPVLRRLQRRVPAPRGARRHRAARRLRPRPRGHGRGRHAAHAPADRLQPQQPDRHLRARTTPFGGWSSACPTTCSSCSTRPTTSS